MNKQSSIYNTYKTNNESLQQYIIVEGSLKLRELFKLEISKIHEQHSMTAEQRGEFDNTYFLSNGQVMEVFVKNGWLYNGVLFRNKESWKNHSEAMNREIYFNA